MKQNRSPETSEEASDRVRRDNRFWLSDRRQWETHPLLVLLLLIFATETLVMLALTVLPTLPTFVGALVDSLVLTLILAPLLWRVVVVPLRKAGRFRGLVEQLLLGIYILDGHGERILYTNPRGDEIFGRAPGELTGVSLSTLVVDDDWRATEHEIRRLVSGELSVASFEFRARRKDGREMTIGAQGLRTHIDGRRAIIGVLKDITERVLGREAQKQSEERFRGLFEHSLIGIYRTTSDGAILMANQALVDMLGYSSVEELTQRNLEQSGFEADYPRLQFKELIEREGDVRGLESVWTRRDGTRLVVRESARNIRDTQGNSIYFEGTVEDIPGRKQAEDALRRSEQFLAQSQRIAHLGNWTLDLETGTLTWSDEMYRIYGVSPDAFVVTIDTFVALVHPDERSAMRSWIDAVLSGNKPGSLEFRLVRPDGAIRVIEEEGEIRVNAENKPILMVGTAQDVTERKRAEQNLARLHRQHDLILSSAAEGILGLDPEGNHTFVNPAAAKMLGYDVEELLGRHSHSTWHHTKADGRSYPKEECQIYAAYRDGTVRRVSSEVFWRKDGTSFPVEYASMPIYEQRRLVGAVVTFTDITERTRAERERASLEAQFRQAQKMETVGRLAGGIAHDFNNLLTVINGTAELILMDVRDDDPLGADLHVIQHAGQRAASLTRQLLAFSRKQIMKLEGLNLSTLLADLQGMLQRLIREDIVLVVRPATKVGHVMADVAQIEQVVMNLVVNARDAMPHGGRLTIETRDVALDEAYAAAHPSVQPGPHVMLAISDTGVGMDTETLARIFEPFFTTKELGKGTGLGLSTVYGIVQQSGGSIGVSSEVGKGTTFTIYLPRVEAVARKVQPTPTVTSVRGTETLLIVEDEEAVRGLAQRILQVAGYTVLTAGHGGEALLVLERHDGPVHLLVTDMVMPGMSGRELATRLEKISPRTKVLFTSGYTDEAILHTGLLDETINFVGKPYTAVELRRRVREVLDS
jgi:PAS domain S-box-containing protein